MATPAESFALGRAVIIVGAPSLQNKLLAKLIAQATGYPCSVRAPGDTLAGGAGMLLLLDAAELGAEIGTACRQRSLAMLALINADDSFAVEALVACPGLKGVFFTDTSEENLAKGIAAIFAGEYWLPRRVLGAHLDRTRRIEPTDGALAPSLTRKELETLSLLATGRSTDHIAQELGVSPHTVKTHIYNLFRKIKVRNRVQAAQWAARHLSLSGAPLIR